MGRLVYSMLCSLDGYVADAEGGFTWAVPDAEVHAAVNELLRPMGTFLHGRGMYDVLSAWETVGTEAFQPDWIQEFAATWRAADKVVYSTTLTEPESERTRIERVFDPTAVVQMAAAATGDVSIGGPTLAAAAMSAGIVDEVAFFVAPVSVGGGLPALPRGRQHTLALLEQRRFESGFVLLRYAVTS